MTTRWARRISIVAALGSLFGCAGETEESAEEVQLSLQALVASKGTATTLDIASWNIEWFGDASNGPGDNDLQRENAFDVIAGSEMDIWGLGEIVSTSQFNQLKSQLVGYAGFLANDPSVVNGSAFYGSTEQKVGILYKSSLASVISARVILTTSDSDFAGRPPLEVVLRVTLEGRTENVVVIVLHAKCCTDGTSWQRRQNASNALKSYLDANHPTSKVWVIGDFNDDVDTSIASGSASPYANFVNDSARYRFPTKALSDSGSSSTVDFPDMIDHHLTSNESFAQLVAGSVEVYRVDKFIANYESTTSDHFPVLSRYSWSGGGTTPTTGQLVLNEICANEPGSNTAGEFVELVNIGASSLSLAGYTISDATGTRHSFASGSSLAPGKAIVVFGDASGIPAGLSNAVSASSGSLNLANGGDSVVLKSSTGATVQSFTYGSALSSRDGVSMNRSPDASASGAFVAHDALSSLVRSPGTRASGAAF